MPNKKLMVSILANSSLALGSRKPYGIFLETLDYVPGSVLRGAVAEVLLSDCHRPDNKRQCDDCPQEIHQNCNFHKLFGNNSRVLFGNAYPRKHSDELSYVIPITAKSCKYKPGFCSEYDYRLRDAEEEALRYKTPPHGVFDTLLTDLIYDEIVAHFESQRFSIPFAYVHKCPRCGGRVDTFQGFYELPEGDDTAERMVDECSAVVARYVEGIQCQRQECLKNYAKVLTGTRRTVKTAINRKRRTAEEGLLYSVDTVDEGTRFVATVVVEEGIDAQIVKTALGKLHQTRLGGGGSRGLGQVASPKNLIRELSVSLSLEQRIKDFNDCIQALWQSSRSLFDSSEKLSEKLEGTYFSIDLQSDAVLRGIQGQLQVGLDVPLLRETLLRTDSQLEENFPCLKLKRAYASPDYIGGWSTAWQLPKEVHLVAAKSSVFLFWTNNIDPLKDALRQLEDSGIGERLEEGFGRIRICDPFHLEVIPV